MLPAVEMIREGLPPFSYTQGKTSGVISTLNQGESQGSGTPHALRTGSHPPIPVLDSLACASTLGEVSVGSIRVAYEKCLSLST